MRGCLDANNEGCLEAESTRTVLGTDARWGSLSYQVKPGEAMKEIKTGTKRGKSRCYISMS